MSRRKKLPKRTIPEYLNFAKELAKFVPGLKKYKRRKTLKPSEKSYISKMANALRFTDNLIPVTDKQYKHLKDELYVPHSPDRWKTDKRTGEKTLIHGKPVKGIRAIRLKGMSPSTKLITVKATDLTIASNGRTWLFWKLDKLGLTERRWRKTVGKAIETAFMSPTEAFPIEKIAKLAELAFKQITTPKAVYLWTRHGPVGQPFRDLPSFMDWLTDTYSRAYKDTDEWMNGIAILVHGPIQQGHLV